ncbi:MAG: recombinase family protein [Thermodesulfobacteriota bacterium]
MRTALGYVMISRDDEDSVSLDYQRAEIKRFCKREGLRLVGIEADEGISGKSVEGRPAVKRVLQAVDSRTVDAVIVFRTDRMSRNGLESLQIEKLFGDRGVAYGSVTEGDVLGQGVDAEFLGFIRAGLNQRERQLVSLRTKAALQRKKEKGERLGRPHYGWKVEGKKLVPVLSEQAVIGKVNELRDSGYSTREIVAALKAEGFATKKGTAISQTQVVRILKAA